MKPGDKVIIAATVKEIIEDNTGIRYKIIPIDENISSINSMIINSDNVEKIGKED